MPPRAGRKGGRKGGRQNIRAGGRQTRAALNSHGEETPELPAPQQESNHDGDEQGDGKGAGGVEKPLDNVETPLERSVPRFSRLSIAVQTHPDIAPVGMQLCFHEDWLEGDPPGGVGFALHFHGAGAGADADTDDASPTQLDTRELQSGSTRISVTTLQSPNVEQSSQELEERGATAAGKRKGSGNGGESSSPSAKKACVEAQHVVPHFSADLGLVPLFQSTSTNSTSLPLSSSSGPHRILRLLSTLHPRYLSRKVQNLQTVVGGLRKRYRTIRIGLENGARRWKHTVARQARNAVSCAAAGSVVVRSHFGKITALCFVLLLAAGSMYLVLVVWAQPVETDVYEKTLGIFALVASLPQVVTFNDFTHLAMINETYGLDLDARWLPQISQYDNGNSTQLWRTNYFGQPVHDIDFLNDLILVALHHGIGLQSIADCVPSGSHSNHHEGGRQYGLEPQRSKYLRSDRQTISQVQLRVMTEAKTFASNLKKLQPFVIDMIGVVHEVLEYGAGHIIRQADFWKSCGFDANLEFFECGSDCPRLDCLLRTGQLTPGSAAADGWTTWTGHFVTMEEQCPFEDERFFRYGLESMNPASSEEKAACHYKYQGRSFWSDDFSKAQSENRTALVLNMIPYAILSDVIYIANIFQGHLGYAVEKLPDLLHATWEMIDRVEQITERLDPDDIDCGEFEDPDLVRCFVEQASRTAKFLRTIVVPRLEDLENRVNNGYDLAKMIDERAVTLLEEAFYGGRWVTPYTQRPIVYPDHRDLHAQVMAAGRNTSQMVLDFMDKAPKLHCWKCEWGEKEIRKHIYSRAEDPGSTNKPIGPENDPLVLQKAPFGYMCPGLADKFAKGGRPGSSRNRLAAILEVNDLYLWGLTNVSHPEGGDLWEIPMKIRNTRDFQYGFKRRGKKKNNRWEGEEEDEYKGPKELCLRDECP